MSARKRKLLSEVRGGSSSARDLRDPARIGEILLTNIHANGLSASLTYDALERTGGFAKVPAYEANPSTLEKYPVHEGAGKPVDE